MELVPLIYMENRKIYTETEGDSRSVDEVIAEVGKENVLYIWDVDGIEENKPNLCTFPKLSEHLEIWVDAGPRVLGDVVDTVMAGATRVTIRGTLFSMEEIPRVKEVTENLIYTEINLRDPHERERDFFLLPGVDGVVVFHEKNQIEWDFKSSELLKTVCNKFKVYAVESDETNISYWKSMGVTGILLDLEKMERVKKRGF